MRVVGVRTTGDFPCARCLVSIPQIPQLGTMADRTLRTSQLHVDDDIKRKKVEDARNLIFGKKHYAVDAEKVEDLLKPTSLVPAMVRSLHHTGFQDIDFAPFGHRTPFLNA